MTSAAMTDDELHTFSIEHLYYELEMLFFMEEWRPASEV